MKYEDLDKTLTYLDGRVKFIFQTGKTILCLDYSNLQGQDFIDFIRKFNEWAHAMEYQPNSLYVLIDTTNNKVNNDVLEEMKKTINDLSKPYCKKTAVYGMETLQKVFVNTLSRLGGVSMKSFDSKEEAIQWLVE